MSQRSEPPAVSTAGPADGLANNAALIEILSAQVDDVQQDMEQSVAQLMDIFVEISRLGDREGAQSSRSFQSLVNRAIVKLQFADRLNQRFQHIRRGLEIAGTAPATETQKLRALYTTADEHDTHDRTLHSLSESCAR